MHQSSLPLAYICCPLEFLSLNWGKMHILFIQNRAHIIPKMLAKNILAKQYVHNVCGHTFDCVCV